MIEDQRQPFRTLQTVEDEDLEDVILSIHLKNGISEDKEALSFIEIP